MRGIGVDVESQDGSLGGTVSKSFLLKQFGGGRGCILYI